MLKKILTNFTIQKNYLLFYFSIKQCKITFLRHAQSQYNVASTQYCKNHSLSHLNWDQICENQQFNVDINYNSQYIDCSITQYGKKQCLKVRQYFESQQSIDLILVSPLHRALMTCQEIFKDLSIPKIVHPELTEVFRYACDVNEDIDTKMSRFTALQFNYFENQDKLWFLRYQSEQTRNLCLQQFHKLKLKSYKEMQLQILILMLRKKIYQSNRQVRMKSNRIKNILIKYSQSYSNILVISHHYVIQNLIAKQFDTINDQPKSEIEDQIPNVTPIKKSLNDLLMVQ